MHIKSWWKSPRFVSTSRENRTCQPSRGREKPWMKEKKLRLSKKDDSSQASIVKVKDTWHSSRSPSRRRSQVGEGKGWHAQVLPEVSMAIYLYFWPMMIISMYKSNLGGHEPGSDYDCLHVASCLCLPLHYLRETYSVKYDMWYFSLNRIIWWSPLCLEKGCTAFVGRNWTSPFRQG